MSIGQRWEVEVLEWTAPGLRGQMVTPQQVLDLVSARSASDAEKAYWKLDGVVCENGVSSRAAVPVAQMLLGLLPDGTLLAKPYCLELLVQMGVAESAEGVREQCLAELRQAARYFMHGVQFDGPDLVASHIDLLGLLSSEFADVRPKARLYLNCALQRELPEPVLALIRNTLAET